MWHMCGPGGRGPSQIVAVDNKQRFSLLEEGAGEAALWIRANQGHSLQGLDEGALLVRLEREEQMPACVVHGTYRAHWPAIREQGLRRMQRTHVHMAKGLPGEGGVLSGCAPLCLGCWEGLAGAGRREG